jgi:pantoate--beta-alanine ligase
MVERGTRDPEAVRAAVAARVRTEPRFGLEYVEVRDADSLEPVTELDGAFVVALAARLGRARLIDNVVIDVRGGRVTADLGVRVSDGPRPQVTP